jgi:hypothetical protein
MLHRERRFAGLALLALGCSYACMTSRAMAINENEWVVQSRALSEEGAVKDALTEASSFCNDKGKKVRIIKMDPVPSNSGEVYSRRQATFTCE